MKGSLLRDDPDPICWSRVGSNVLSFGIASGILAGIGLRSAFLLKKHSITPSVLHKLPANSSSIIFGVLTGAVGGLYGFNREMVKIIQPTRPVAPLYVQQLKDDLVTIPKVHSSFSPRSQIAYQLILQDLFKHEFGLMKEYSDEFDDYYYSQRLLDVRIRNPNVQRLSIHGEILSLCMIGWMLIPLTGGFVLNTGISVVLGSLIYYIKELFVMNNDYKLMEGLLNQRIELLKEKEIIDEKEVTEIENELEKLKPQLMPEYFSEMKNTFIGIIRKILSPVAYEIEEERVKQFDYLRKVEKEYQAYRVSQGKDPGASYF